MGYFKLSNVYIFTKLAFNLFRTFERFAKCKDRVLSESRRQFLSNNYAHTYKYIHL